MKRAQHLLLPLLIATALMVGNRIDYAEEALTEQTVIAWQSVKHEGIAGRYLIPADQCYPRYERFLSKDQVHRFATSEEAEKAGFVRKIVGVSQLKKYATVCSRLYDYLLASACQKHFFDDESVALKAGYVRIEEFQKQLAEVPIPALVRSKVYLTPCDPEYRCYLNGSASSPDCTSLSEEQVQIFQDEAEARKSGYISQYEFYLSELDDRF